MKLRDKMEKLEKVIPESGCCEKFPIELLEVLGFKLVEFHTGVKGDPWIMIWVDECGDTIQIDTYKGDLGEDMVHFAGYEKGTTVCCVEFKRQVLHY